MISQIFERCLDYLISGSLAWRCGSRIISDSDKLWGPILLNYVLGLIIILSDEMFEYLIFNASMFEWLQVIKLQNNILYLYCFAILK